MQNDRQITISCGNSRKAVDWRQETLLISELWDKLRVPARGKETVAQYLGLKKTQQDELKDVGGFVGGSLNGPRRKARNVTGRDIITLDFDNIPPGGKDDVLRRIGALGCGYCVYSTRKHQPAAPRLRVLLPLDRTVTADEYEPIARKAAEWIGLGYADHTTFDVSRLMYWPSCCADSEYIYFAFDGPLVSASGVLGQYADWRDQEQWPQVPGTQNTYKKLAAKQGDPESKNGVVGAFCRTYDIYRAMDELLPGIYEPCDTMPGRYTYTGGSTTGGAVIYDDGKFLFSHHATDPCSGKLVNAFDLVRLHKFGDADDEADPATPTNRLPSYTAMCEFAHGLPDVSALLDRERYENAIKDFEGITATETAPENWMSLCSKSPSTGNICKDPDNVKIALEYDPLLKNRLINDTFAHRLQGICPLPWEARKNKPAGTVFKWEDKDDNGLALYIKRVLGFYAPNITAAGLLEFSGKIEFNPVQEYLKSCKWDGVPRLDTLFIDYLGAADNLYTRAVTRKAFTAAVARAMTPGCKYDNMVILSGPQGIGKSTLLSIMAGDWFNDSIRTFEGKDASELLQGTWLVEVAELDAFRGSDVSRIKQFLSVRTDKFRKAYGRNTGEYPRSCVFFGTTNASEYLRDKTGNRRFWPIDTSVQPATKNIFNQLQNERDQLWAEAFVRWQAGEPLYLEGEVKKIAEEYQEGHRETSAREATVLGFISKNVPEDWSKWPLDKRRMYWGGITTNDVSKPINLVPRDRVCALEVWCEAFGGSIKEYNTREASEINSVIAASGEWERSNGPIHIGGGYSKLRGYYRKKQTGDTAT
mgnify:CR=1 FL=1